VSAMSAIKVLLVDPSRFTVPYDAQLAGGLAEAGVEQIWATRPLRPNEVEELPTRSTHQIFYRRFDRPKGVPRFVQGPLKAISHLAGLCRLVWLARQARVDLVHFQWTVLPVLDSVAIWLLRSFCSVILTVHDSVPFNGQQMPFFQRFAFDLPMRLVDRVIVHSQTAKRTLVNRGVAEGKITIAPHGPLPLRSAPAISEPTDGRWTFVMFGHLKPYKGIDVVIEAVGTVADTIRGRARIVIAGPAHMELEPLYRRIDELALADVVELRSGYLSDEALASLLQGADCLLFPYRQIDASGAYFLAKPLNKWIIASAVGVFADDLVQGQTGTLVPPSDSNALAQAMVQALESRPKPDGSRHAISWAEIGALTARQYGLALTRRRPGRMGLKSPAIAGPLDD
jgi:glycosyltransferase involved in cell wall biosynthesis